MTLLAPHADRPLRGAALAAIGSLVLACGTAEQTALHTPPPVTVERTAPPTSLAPRVERFTLTRGGSSTVEGVPTALIGVSLGDAAQPASAEASIGDATAYVYEGGCVATPFGAVALEHADMGPAPWARFAWTPSRPDVDGSDQAPHELAVGTTLVANGWRVQAVAVEPQPSGVTRAWLTASSPAFDSGAEHRVSVDVPAAGHAEVPITALTSIDVSIAGRDPIGCPISSATFIDPRAIVLDVTEGEARAIRAGTTLRLGALAVRYDGMGERRTTTGDRALLFLTAAPGTADERAFQCSPDAPCSDGGLAIELVSFEGTFTTLRVRAAPAAP